MPPLPGEDRVQTVFADIHYYFTAPSPRPLHHRFDKGSYLYIYHNATRPSTRLEIANHPGTSDQDAFQGSLDGVKLRYSYQFPTLLTVVVDAGDVTPKSPSTPPATDGQEWRLASADPRDQGQYKYRLHTLDIYFWTVEDAKAVIEASQRLLRSEQVDILGAPPKSGNDGQPQEGALSPVVQQLENVANTDPAYGNGQTRNSQNQATALASPPPTTMRGNSTQPSSGQAGPAKVRSTSVKSDEAQTNFTPMAYNPAAPAAPEPIAHREKTPPPADAGDGTGLAAATYADHNQGYADQHHLQPYPHAAGQPQQAGPGHYGSPAAAPSPQQPGSGRYGSPQASAYATPLPSRQALQQHRPSTTSMPPASPRSSVVTTSQAVSPLSTASPAGSQPSFSPPPGGYAPPPQREQHRSLGPPHPTQTHPLAQQPLESPSAQVYGSTQLPPHQTVPHLQPHYADYLQSHPPSAQHQQQAGHQHQQPHPQPPPGGYSQYSYAQQQQPAPAPPPSSQHYPYHPQQQQPPHHHHHHHQNQHQHPDSSNGRYDIHNQLYRPTEDEEDKDRHRRRQSSTLAPGSAGSGGGGGGSDGSRKPMSRLESKAVKVDKRVGGLLKKLEKKL